MFGSTSCWRRRLLGRLLSVFLALAVADAEEFPPSSNKSFYDCTSVDSPEELSVFSRISSSLGVASVFRSAPRRAEHHLKCDCFARLDGTNGEEDGTADSAKLLELPAFTSDESFYLISAHVVLTRWEVVFVGADHVDNNYAFSAEQRGHVAHGLDRADVFCDFAASSALDHLYGPAQKLVHRNDHHVITISCHMPSAVKRCLAHRRKSRNRVPACVDVWLKTREGQGGKLKTVARVRACQVDDPLRQDFLAMCAQPLTSSLWPLVAPWMEYHNMLGMQRFYLYTPERGLDWWVKPYIRDGLAEIRLWIDPAKGDWAAGKHHVLRQITAQNDCVYRYMDHAKWVAFFDVDEYYYPFKVNNLHGFLEPHTGKEVGALKVWTEYFHVVQDDDGALPFAITNYDCDGHLHKGEREKNFVQLSQVQMISVHLVMYGKPTVTVGDGELRLNHYRKGFRKTHAHGHQDNGMDRFLPNLTTRLQQRFAEYEN